MQREDNTKEECKEDICQRKGGSAASITFHSFSTLFLLDGVTSKQLDMADAAENIRSGTLLVSHFLYQFLRRCIAIMAVQASSVQDGVIAPLLVIEWLSSSSHNQGAITSPLGRS